MELVSQVSKFIDFDQLKPEQFFSLILGLSNLGYLFNAYINWRQHRVYRREHKAPKEVASICTAEEYEASRVYGKDKSGFGLFSDLVGQIQSNFFFVASFYPWAWQVAGELASKVVAKPGEITKSVAFFVITMLLSTLADLPFSWYSTFQIEQKHGFNKQTYGIFVMDKIKTVLLSVVFGAPIVSALIWTIRWGGERFYLAVWLLMAGIQLVMIVLYPSVIQPLFNKFEPLKEGELKTKIEALAKKLAFPLTKLYVMDGSTRSSHSNAYFFGLFNNKRIVLFDTLLTQMGTDEICAVLGHELGHWSCSHMFKRLVIIQFHLFSLFYLFSKVINNGALYEAFGFTGEKPVIIGFTLFQTLLVPLELAMSLLISWQSRCHEFEADRFASALGYNELLQSGLIKLHAKNRSFVHPDWIYSTLHYSHPPLTERLAALKQLKSKSK
jgi:STE24 endopeptidase